MKGEKKRMLFPEDYRVDEKNLDSEMICPFTHTACDRRCALWSPGGCGYALDLINGMTCAVDALHQIAFSLSDWRSEAERLERLRMDAVER